MPDAVIDLGQLPHHYNRKGGGFVDAFWAAVDTDTDSRGRILVSEQADVTARAARYDDGDGCLTPQEVLAAAKKQLAEDRVQLQAWQHTAEVTWDKCAKYDDCRDSTYARWQAAAYARQVKINEKLIKALEALPEVAHPGVSDMSETKIER